MKIKCMRPKCKCTPKLVKKGKTYDTYKCELDEYFSFETPKVKDE